MEQSHLGRRFPELHRLVAVQQPRVKALCYKSVDTIRAYIPVCLQPATLPASISTMLKKLESVSEANRDILKVFYQYMSSKDHKTERHIIDILSLLISLDKFCAPLSFTSINNKEQLLTFLDHRKQKDGKWVKREHDVEGRYITSFNFYLGLLRIFFRWLVNRDKSPEDWETPAFLKIKTKKPLRESPYGINDIWELDDVLTIVEYETELRNQAINTLLWDLDARPHEITALRIRDIILNEQYGEGTIPSNTKTGGGPILLTSSFTHVRDWINKHPFKNEPNARLICNLVNGAPVTTQVIWQVMNRLRLHIKRLLQTESGAIEEQRKQKLEHLLRTKKWNPYCFRHSAITDDSDHLPEYAVKKKARWVMGSKQANRYIKQRLGSELRDKILERHGIKIENKQPQMVSRTCGRCGYVNKLENKYCERSGCNYPLTQLALDEIKAAERAMMQELVNKSNSERDRNQQVLAAEMEAKDQEVHELKDQMSQMMQTFESYHGLAKERMNQMDDSIRFLTNEITKYRGQFGPRPLTEKERRNIDKFKKEIQALPPSEYIPEYDG
jgi:integrase/recombinase XerD